MKYFVSSLYIILGCLIVVGSRLCLSLRLTVLLVYSSVARFDQSKSRFTYNNWEFVQHMTVCPIIAAELVWRLLQSQAYHDGMVLLPPDTAFCIGRLITKNVPTYDTYDIEHER